VSAQEQETYRRLQSQFSAVKKDTNQVVQSNGTGKGKGKEVAVYANGNDEDEGVDGRTWVGQKSVQRAFDDSHDEEYRALYSQDGS
jgi:hypothetical protein